MRVEILVLSGRNECRVVARVIIYSLSIVGGLSSLKGNFQGHQYHVD